MRLAALAVAAWVGAPAGAERLAPSEVPEALRPWVAWTLRGHEASLCPFLHGSGARSCAWPGRLALELGEDGGRFVQDVRVDAPGPFALPGDTEHWPEEVQVDGKPAAPILQNGRPELRLEPGPHEVSGRFVWARLPALLAVPQETGMVALRLAGEAVAFPERDELGRLWLRDAGEEQQGGERRIEVELHRKVTDEVPLLLETRITLRVSGPAREEAVGPLLPDGFVAFGLDSPLPVRLEPDGSLRVQVRPGSYELSLEARQVRVVTEGAAEVLAVPAQAGNASPPAREVWVFEARPSLRLVTVEGVPVDPQQTSLPREWRELPAYLLEAGTPLRLTQRHRGDADPAPDELSLQRTWHLDFAGGGATVSDRIEGTFRGRARLEMGEGTELGRASVNGVDQFLTRLVGSEKVGIQVSPGKVEVAADSRVAGGALALPAVGWDHDFAGLSALLELPPGYELLHAAGVDRARWSWLERWDLLDLFLVLVVAVAFLRLYGPRFLALAALTLALTATEPGAPRWVWVAVLAAEALRRVVPAGRFARTLAAARWLSLAALAVLAVPFAVGALRAALYPALAGPVSFGVLYASEDAAAFEPPAPSPATIPAEAMPDVQESASPEQLRALGYGQGKVRRYIDVGRLTRGGRDVVREEREPRTSWQLSQDPNSRITTGPGVPTWSWRQVRLEWSGPVERGAVLRLFLIPPWANALLGVARVLLLGVLAARLLGVRFQRPVLPVLPPAAVLLFAFAAASAPAGAAEFPPQELLDELRTRLLEDASCAPECAAISRLGIEARGDTLRLSLDVSAAADTAVPLPGGATSWLPAEVRADGAPSSALLRGEDGTLWLRVAAGIHRVELEGPLPPTDAVALPLLLAPRRAEATLEGWTLAGLRPDGRVEGALQLVREAGSATQAEPRDVPALAPFLRVERSLGLGLTWSGITWVTRLSPADAALVIEVPLLEGESVTSPEVEVREGKARISLAPNVAMAGFESVLATRESLVLTAPRDVPWSETWRLTAGPIWHLVAEGIPPIQADPAGGGDDLAWRPWPGESVRVTVVRPEGVAGATLTLDSSQLRLRPGVRSTDAELGFALRSSQGGEHRVTLPEGATLQRVAIDGREQPLRQEGRAVVVPVRPGTETVEIAWREAEGIRAFWRAAEVDLGAPSVNAEILVEPPAGRWLLWVSGPPLGPALLFWPVLAAYLAIAAVLGRTRLAPLRARDWALLALGLTQVGVVGAGIVALWLLALGARAEYGMRVPGRWFDLAQIGLVALTVAALGALVVAIRAGLLGVPDMQIAGNGSSADLLRWYQDRSGAVLPRPRVVSLPLGVYRLAMLLWALWIAQALVSWLRFGWRAFSAGELWRPLRRPRTASGAVGGPP